VEEAMVGDEVVRLFHFGIEVVQVNGGWIGYDERSTLG